jgi:hypothetical protein
MDVQPAVAQSELLADIERPSARASPVPGNPGTPSVPVTAKIQARGMDGSLLGWVASDLQEYAGESLTLCLLSLAVHWLMLRCF